MKNYLPELTPAEWIVMKKVWQLKKTNVREVYEDLQDSREWAYNTVRTIMDRLRAKGYLEAKRVGNMHFYEPAVTRGKTVKNALQAFSERVFDGAIGSLFASLIKEDKLSEEEI